MTGIGPEFLKILEGVDWDSLDAKSATLLRAALKTALVRSDEWFAALARDFGGAAHAKVASGRPADEVIHPREPRPTVSAKVVNSSQPKRKRGRPPKAKPTNRPTATPLAVGGADAHTHEEPRPAQIFQDSYVSKEGPRPGAALPADHPRNRAMMRESSVTPEVDMSDFAEVEAAMKTGKGVKDVFQ